MPNPSQNLAKEAAGWSTAVADRWLRQACEEQSPLLPTLIKLRPDRLTNLWGQWTWSGQGDLLKALAVHWLPTLGFAEGWLDGNSMDEVRAGELWPDLVTLPTARIWLAELAPRIQAEHPDLAERITSRLRAHALQQRPAAIGARPRRRS